MVVTADQLTKTWAVDRLTKGAIHVIGPLDLSLTVNTGGAFGLAQGWAPVIASLAVLLVAVLLVAARHARSTFLAVSLGLVVGGAVGNLADRVFRGYHGGVVDFIDFHFWPTFNVADSCITVGTVLVAGSFLLGGRTGSQSSGGDGSPSDDEASREPASEVRAANDELHP